MYYILNLSKTGIDYFASSIEEGKIKCEVNHIDFESLFFIDESKEDISHYKVENQKIVKKTSGDLLQEKLAFAKAKKLQELADYDISPAVNSFTINGIEIWLSKELRTALKNRAESILSLYNQGIIESKSMEIEVIPCVFISLDADKVLFMLQKLEYYAGECYVVTSKHAATINELANNPNISIEEILSYNFKVGYPEKLNF